MFAEAARERAKIHAPLAARMRPRTLEEFVGQEGIVGEGKALRRAIEEDRVPSLVFWGPPGTGKTTLARIIASLTKSHFEAVSAVSAGVADLRRIVGEARDRLGETGQRTILFIDEIHRFNKAQQDAILPHVEDGTVTLIGATTENPFFEINGPLMSRMTLFRLEPLLPEDLTPLLESALRDDDRGLGEMDLELSPDVAAELATRTGGDARQSLNALEVAALLAAAEHRSEISEADVAEALQRRIVRYDKTGDSHYDVISAFIKSVRGSDPDAALYWLFLMLEGGEDPEFIVRRLVILASEDIGLADSSALQVAVAASQALAYVGLPEATYHLTHATIYLATAPKSNSLGLAIQAGKELVQNGPTPSVPLPLRSTGYQGARVLGHGAEYVYP
ncbi:MAG: replication-associated recombination protein A, partial [Chloroflexi bacterium]